jgi:protein TonB
MSDKITKFVQKKFNTDLAGDLGLTGKQRISVIFKIDKKGNVTGVRSRAPHPRLEKEAARVVNMLPKMKPGRQRGKAVVVPYSLPITFLVQE